MRAGAALATSDREGFDKFGEEDRGECPAREGNDAGTGDSRRVAARRPHRQQLRSGLDAAHSESTVMAMTTATGREHEDGNGGGDCEDVTMEGGSHRSLGDCDHGGGDAACLTDGNRIKWEGKLDCSNDGGMKLCADYNN